MNKKKVAFIIHSMSSGGAERVISILSNYFCDIYNIYIIVLVDKPSFYSLNPSVTLLRSEHKPKPTKGISAAVHSNFKTYKSILKILKKQKINLAIGFLTANNILATFAAKRLGIPVIICERNNPFIQSASTPISWKILRRLTYPMANILTVQTQRVREFYTSFIEEQKLVTIPNPIDPNLNRDSEIEKLNIILNVGSLENQKGQDILIRAFFLAKLEGWQLHIIGDGSRKAKLKELIKELGLQKSVFLLGKKTNIAEHYASCKIFAFSSRYEGFPNALLEALYFGLPCVSTDCQTGPAELIENEVNGYLVPVDDAKAFSLKLHQLVSDDNLRVTFGHKASISVKKYEIKEVVKKWQHIINSLLT